MKKWIIITGLLVWSWIGWAQNDLGTMNDMDRIALQPIALRTEGTTEQSMRLLESRLMQLASSTGLAAKGERSQFALVGRVTLVDKNVTMSAPPMQTVTLQFDCYVIDLLTETVFNNYTQELKGVGENDTKAYNSAIKTISPKNSGIKAMIQKGKMKMVEYYNAQCEQVLEKAKVMASSGMLVEAVTIYYNIPEVCAECSQRANESMGELLTEYQTQKCNEYSATCIAMINAGEDKDEIMKVFNQLITLTNCDDKINEVLAAMKEKNLNDQALQAQQLAQKNEAERQKEMTPELAKEKSKEVVSYGNEEDRQEAAMENEEKAMQIVGG